MNRAQQCATQNARHAHHVERVEREVVEALNEQDEAENRRYPKAGRKEPARLTQGIDQEDRDKHCNRARKSQRVVRTDADQTGDFKLTQHEANQAKCAMQGDKGPQAAQADTSG